MKNICICMVGLSAAVFLTLVLAWRCAAVSTFFAILGIIISLSNAIAMTYIAVELEKGGK